MVFKKNNIPWNTGKNLSEETKIKISLGNLGKKLTEEHKRKISLAHKGKNIWTKGRHYKMKQETKDKLRKVHLGMKASEQARKKMSLFQKGKKMPIRTEEHKRKISLANTGKVLSEKHKEKIRENARNNPKYGNKGRKMSEETRRKNSLAHSGDKSFFWNGGISYEPYTSDWNNTLKIAIRQRDDYTCKLCFLDGKSIHHIDYNKKNCNPENLITLCKKCHCKTNFNREMWKTFFQNKLYKLF